MRIGIDATSVPARPAGAGVYALELVRGMAERDRRDGYALFARTRLLDDVVGARKNWRAEHVRGGRVQRLMWEQALLPGRLSTLGIDVLHSTHHTLPVRPMRSRRVVTVHDVTFLRIPRPLSALTALLFSGDHSVVGARCGRDHCAFSRCSRGCDSHAGSRSFEGTRGVRGGGATL